MITANTAEMLRAAQVLLEQAKIIERHGQALENELAADNARKRFFIFKKPFGKTGLAKKRRQITDGLAAQSLFLRECAKQYRGAQSRAIVRAGMK